MLSRIQSQAMRPLISRSGFVGIRTFHSGLIRFNATTATSTTTGRSTNTPKRIITLDKELPDPFSKQKKNRLYFVAYGIGIIVSCIIIFNYEKTQSPIITSALYFLRRSETAKKLLGSDINYASSWPWIWGELNTVKGDIDITFDISGDNGAQGTIKLKATRISRAHPFDIHHFLLVVDNKEYDLSKDNALQFGL
ncbi:cytochrome oxidase complex assembly protein 1-domain-containing protein [Scheffersomyces amazonensis]|uniref:cytochrome oxidase complex assembly protein 1-domain-containing protein n=1 Tax=Scheffersomyces amazonensis TaxID=1078765 RepID=UPI00315CDAA3